MIRPLVRSDDLKLWDVSQIPQGGSWREEIEKALASAKVALLMVSDEFLASEFVSNLELPPLLEAAQRERLLILWVCLSPCFVEFTPINDYQAVVPPSQFLEGMSAVEQKVALKTIALSLRDALATPPPTVPQGIDATRGLLLRQGDGWQIQKQPIHVQGYDEHLGEGVALRLIQIPAGKFLMGSPPDEPERSNDEGPQHEVALGAFFLGQTPITQAQWRVVAGWEQVERTLQPDPSQFKGANRPVEQVSWIDAMEFCRRLSQRTGRAYTLPSEAQWEYACRAATTTPFHFGATITPELANYNGNYTYGDGPKGTYREQTTDVGSFPANAWGLQDLHGNVWDWCLDHWHDSYEGAPGDGSAWLDPRAGKGAKRLLRGGSWLYDPRFCRSAYRFGLHPGPRYFDVGFRVCCLPPGSSS